MTFSESVSSYLTNWNDFYHSSPKAEYWWVVLFNIIVEIILNIARIILLFSVPVVAIIFNFIIAIVGIFFFIAGLALSVRRLHDTGHSGWCLLWVLLPIIGPIGLIIAMGFGSSLYSGNPYQSPDMYYQNAINQGAYRRL